ncbi:tyrosyl-tRNA synthetase, putative [Perkinsus marinus ATCC 50983]|uniref:tyrosine--tRNA ligase n=1 Tax=Perkinsus marinus (strain ATCC 50983 / TXsc) TaxID=423536 RepID=C5LH41_PERM5|nr:tyrosyl-tRNA synthetase, putative [Perkinsus marinus ATCC 50983]EER03850.1 tyrosyl-tRNA synthetase, putative [Perkinsus marinus ATCC 50983]|eukprot:XP_002772034.1 tyrosyl-tRNA synthetase, putative [Perkinsus marinus ATCC 50983]
MKLPLAPSVSAFTGGLTLQAVVPTSPSKTSGSSPQKGGASPRQGGKGSSSGPSVVPVAGYDPIHTVMATKPVASKLSLDERVAQCMAVANYGGEIIQEEEVRKLFEAKANPICYDGFEPSGRMHIAQGILKAINVNRLTSAGCVFVFWVADWFGLLNNKMGGDLEKIKKVGQYFVEVWKAAGMDMDNVRFLRASEEINKNPQDYWLRVMNIARANSISRVKRCGQIMGRSEGDEQPSAQILYPCMQCSDIFYLHADICQLGMDQRKVNMLAREYMDKPEASKDKQRMQGRKPIIVSHAMVPGLLEGQEKMSKSNPDSAIFMEDSEADVKRKIKKAFCPPNVVEGNPCVTYVKMLVFPYLGKFEVQRKEANGGDVTFKTVEEFEHAYAHGELHPGDLKAALTRCLNQMIEPVRHHFETNPEAKALLAEIKSYKVTK